MIVSSWRASVHAASMRNDALGVTQFGIVPKVGVQLAEHAEAAGELRDRETSESRQVIIMD